jgi:predicted ferric reductase
MARAWSVIGSLLLVPIALWATARPLGDRFADTTATLGSLANITALAGMSAFAVNLAIGSRLRAIVRLFGSLEAMYAAHVRLAISALALLAAHAVLAAGHAASRSGEDALELFLPASGWAVFAGTVALAGMTAAFALIFFGHLSHEAFVIVQKILGVTFAVAALHGLGVSGTRSSTRCSSGSLL